MDKREWMISGAAVAVCLVLATILVTLIGTSGDSDAETPGDKRALEPPIPTAATKRGEELACGEGEAVRAYYNQVASEFVVIGQLTDADGGYFTVDGPTGELAMRLAMDSDVEGSYVIGEPIEVGGRSLADGTLEATKVRPGCTVAVAAATTEPSSGTPAPSGSPTAAPASTRAPVAIPVLPADDDPSFFEPDPTDPPATDPPTAAPTAAPTPAPTAAPTEDPRPTRTAPVEEPTS